jgi:hypothetical protein
VSERERGVVSVCVMYVFDVCERVREFFKNFKKKKIKKYLLL